MSEASAQLLSVMSQRVPDKLIQFGRALQDADALVDGWPYFLEKPWKWAAEFDTWVALDSPQVDDATWDAFYEALTVLDNA